VGPLSHHTRIRKNLKTQRVSALSEGEDIKTKKSREFCRKGTLHSSGLKAATQKKHGKCRISYSSSLVIAASTRTSFGALAVEGLLHSKSQILEPYVTSLRRDAALHVLAKRIFLDKSSVG